MGAHRIYNLVTPSSTWIILVTASFCPSLSACTMYHTIVTRISERGWVQACRAAPHVPTRGADRSCSQPQRRGASLAVSLTRYESFRCWCCSMIASDEGLKGLGVVSCRTREHFCSQRLGWRCHKLKLVPRRYLGVVSLCSLLCSVLCML